MKAWLVPVERLRSDTSKLKVVAPCALPAAPVPDAYVGMPSVADTALQDVFSTGVATQLRQSLAGYTVSVGGVESCWQSEVAHAIGGCDDSPACQFGMFERTV